MNIEPARLRNQELILMNIDPYRARCIHRFLLQHYHYPKSGHLGPLSALVHVTVKKVLSAGLFEPSVVASARHPVQRDGR